MTIMNKYIILITLFLISFTNIIAQQISITVSGYEGKVNLYSLEGENTILIDSLITDDGKFIIETENYNFHNGFYRVRVTERTWIDFIYYGNDIQLKTDIKNIGDNLVVVKSDGNKLFHQFIRLNKDYKTKTELLQLLLSRYPADDDFYAVTQNKLILLQNEYLEFVNITSQSEPNSFAARYIKSAQLPVLSLEIAPQNQISYLQSHSLDNVNFSDAELIYSDLFTNKSIEYLMYYRNPQLPKELLEKEFMKAADSLLTKAKVNDLVYQHITEYLISGFKQFGFDNIIDYIIQKYVVEDDICLDETLENSIQRRIDQSKKLAVGTITPNIEMAGADGTVFNLAEINSDNTLLIFYASWCPHCQTLLPEINTFYINEADKELEVVAISLDDNKEDWLKFISDNNPDLVNVSDGLGWDGKASSDYSIYATPTMFLLDKEKKIIAKPMNIDELKISLSY